MIKYRNDFDIIYDECMVLLGNEDEDYDDDDEKQEDNGGC